MASHCAVRRLFGKEASDMNSLPKDPVMLLSVVNTQLRDHYGSLSELAAAYMVDAEELSGKLAAIGYAYDEQSNQFR
jgi:hypothetical protein